jgi:hypothetical protein
MNERLKELAEQANANFREGSEFAVVFGELKDFERFAGLLIEECMAIGFNSVYNVVDDRNAVAVWRNIKENFEVK